eukprot:scaffold151582_cov18-Prasinocladus_malaysianus.AAC.1
MYSYEYGPRAPREYEYSYPTVFVLVCTQRPPNVNTSTSNTAVEGFMYLCSSSYRSSASTAVTAATLRTCHCQVAML